MTITPTLDAAPADRPTNSARTGMRWQKRRSLSVRVLHWANALALAGLLMSGLQIFDAHPSPYWGSISTFDAPSLTRSASLRNSTAFAKPPSDRAMLARPPRLQP